LNRLTTSAFNLPGRLAAKADPALIGGDEKHFAAIAESLERSIADLSGRLEGELRAPGGIGQEAMDRDTEIHRLAARLRVMSRFGLDLCLGRIVGADNSEPVYIGRLGLRDSADRQLLIDWRSPAAEPFFGATHARPMGLASRRRYRWTGGRVSDYWDEVFTPDGLEGRAALDDQSAFIASLGSSRSPRMRDVLGTIAADQDAIIRAGSRGALVVDGGPGTGKTVVALHRSAYLLYSDPRLGPHRGGVLFVGPHQPYLAYVADVLPSLGEEGVRICTLRDLLPEGATAADERDPEVARLKSSADMVKAIEPAVKFYENPPTKPMIVQTHWSNIQLTAADWTEAFDAAEPGIPHNEARDRIWAELLTILVDRHDGDAPEDLLRKSLQQNRDLRAAVNRAWPLIEPDDLVGDLWSVPAYLRMCAPWLSPDEVRKLQREDAQAWTGPDLPLLDAARQRLGDPQAARRKREREAASAYERERMTRAVDNLIEGVDDEYGMGLVTMLRGEDFHDALVDEAALASTDPDLLAGPFAHIVVDEAQELTDAQWQMLLLRCPSLSFTIVGDRAQARHGFAESWPERLERLGLDQVTLASLTINYRTPEEVMAEAEPVIRAVLPDANVPASIRSTGVPVLHGSTPELTTIVDNWLADHAEGIACVIGDSTFQARPRVQSLTPELSKGLEFDLVVLVDPADFGVGIEGAVDRYVAMTRATQRLVILTRPVAVLPVAVLPDPRVEDRIAEVGQQVTDDRGDGRHDREPQQRGDVVVQRRRVEGESGPLIVEHDLDEEVTGHQGGDRQPEQGHDRDQGVAERVAPQHPALAGALGVRGAHVVLHQVLQNRGPQVLAPYRVQPERVGGNREHQRPRIGQRRDNRRRRGHERREQMHVGGEPLDEYQPDQEGGGGVAEERHPGQHVVTFAVSLRGLVHAQRYAEDQRHHQAERDQQDRLGQGGSEQVGHVLVQLDRVAKVAVQQLPDPLDVLDVKGLVEPVHAVEVIDLGR
jgi:hypothetical protein